MKDEEIMRSEIDENSSEVEILRHALHLALNVTESFTDDLDEEGVEILEFCERVVNASAAGDMTEVRREIAESDDDA